MTSHHSSAAQTERLRKYRPDIQGLRAVAIMMVVSMHCGILDIHGGVDVSFVLSGFLIGSQLLAEIDKTGKVSLSKFWARRFRRLAPGMAITVISTAVLAYVYGSPFKFRDFMTDGLAAALSIMNWRLVETGTDYFAADGNQSPYQHFWSLGIEEQFYVAAPIILFVMVWISRAVFRNRALVGLFLVGVIGVSLYLSVKQTASNQPLAYFGTQTRVWELASGILLALIAPFVSRMNLGLAGVLSWLGIGTMIGTALLITEETPLPGYAVAGPVGGALLTIAGGCAAPRFGAERLLKNPVFNFVGNVSYGWYLWHWPLLILWPDITGGDLSFSDRFRVASLSLILAVVQQAIVEKRFRENVRLVLQPWRGILTGGALTTSAAAITLIALHVPLNLPLGTTGSSAAAMGFEGTASVRLAVSQRNHPQISQSNLLKAPHDRGDFGCIDQLLVTGYTLRDECVIGDKAASRTMVLLGDSHAFQWGNAFNEVGRQLHVKVVTVIKSGCPPEDYEIAREDLGRTYTECYSWRKTAVAEIAKLKPAVIVVANRVQSTGTREGADALFHKLKATGADLVYLTDTPYPEFSVPDCLAKNAHDLSVCSPKSEKFLDHAENRVMEREVAVQNGATVIDTIPAFCAQGYCPAVIGGHVVYWDYSHMSGSYATSLAPYIQPALKKVLTGGTGTAKAAAAPAKGTAG